MKKIMKPVLLVILAILLVYGCADNEIVKTNPNGFTYGFWGGLWHGIIAPFDLIGMLIYDDVAMYAPNNNGIWYSFGFLLGVDWWRGAEKLIVVLKTKKIK
jgi:hypothetical protein